MERFSKIIVKIVYRSKMGVWDSFYRKLIDFIILNFGITIASSNLY